MLINDFLTAGVIKNAFGLPAIGYISGAGAATAAAFSLATSYTTSRLGRQTTMQFGIISFLLLGVLTFVVVHGAGGAESLLEPRNYSMTAFSIGVLYLCAAAGRGVWESTNRYTSAGAHASTISDT